ncbi:MAG: glycosyltransferase family 2 protein [Oscillatoriaceae cyanobacterium Prado104]|jgi:glycosyltransferase involved in cell wall biosynthesis|nr:glycosyltransferase family 2 protein [Oscillatoriaceae cyanobacterium Prado104]
MSANTSKNDLAAPLVSVIIPACNAGSFIAQTLESVLSQTYQKIEVLVVDDGSTDATPEIVKYFAEKDSRVNLLQRSNAGVAIARNLAVSHSKGEFIAPIDADDIWEPQNLEKQVKLLTESEPFVGVVYSWSLDIDEGGLLTGGFYNSTLEGEVRDALVYKYFIGNASSSLIRRACFEKVGGYNSKLKLENAQGCEDWELHLRIAKYYQFKVVPEYLVGYRQIASSMSCNYAAMAKGHSLIMADVRRDCREVPEKVYRWSSSNFYIYLAVKSDRNGDYRSTLLWLYRALKDDFLMVMLRHNLYLLSIKNMLKMIFLPLTKSNLELKQRHSTIFKNPAEAGSPIDREAADRLNKPFQARNRMTSEAHSISSLNPTHEKPLIDIDEKCQLKPTSKLSEGTTLEKIETRTKIHRLLPSQIYERMRLNSLKGL